MKKRILLSLFPALFFASKIPAHAQIVNVADAPKDKLVVAALGGFRTDRLRGNELVTDTSPVVPIIGLTAVGRLPDVNFIPFIKATNWAASFSGDLSGLDGDAISSDRYTADVSLIAPTNEFFAFSIGYRFERATDEARESVINELQAARSSFNSARFGVSGNIPLFPSNDLTRFVGSVHFAVGRQNISVSSALGDAFSDSSVFFGPEISAGFIRDFGSISAELRYRATLHSTNIEFGDDTQTSNTLSLSIGYKF